VIYSVGMITLATLIGGPLCGSWLMALNYKRFAEPRNARMAKAFGVHATVAAIALWLTVRGGGLLRLVIVPVIAACLLALLLQGEAYDQHVALDGSRGSARPAGGPRPGTPRAASARIAVIERGVLRLFDAREVTRLWASDNVHAVPRRWRRAPHPGAAHRPRASPRVLPLGFMRVHRGELINVARVRAVRAEHGQYLAALDDGQAVRISRRVLTAFKTALGVCARRARAGRNSRSGEI